MRWTIFLKPCEEEELTAVMEEAVGRIKEEQFESCIWNRDAGRDRGRDAGAGLRGRSLTGLDRRLKRYAGIRKKII